MSFQLLCKQDEAHDDSIWSVAWCSNSLDGIEYILTGGADGVVKVKTKPNTFYQPVPYFILTHYKICLNSRSELEMA